MREKYVKRELTDLESKLTSKSFSFQQSSSEKYVGLKILGSENEGNQQLSELT